MKTQTNNICLVCPIYPPDFISGQFLSYQIIDTDMDLCFIFTSNAEKDSFNKLTCKSNKPWFTSIVLEDYFSNNTLEIVLKNRSFPTFKKFFGLDQLKCIYNWLICIDAETYILKKNNWELSCEAIFNTKIWYGGEIKENMVGELEILKRSASEIIPNSDTNKLRELTNNFNFYSWWWDLPIYKTEHIEKFLEWIDWQNTDKFVKNLSWFTFDHIVYQYYTALYCDFKLIAVKWKIHSLEFSYLSDYKKAQTQLRCPTWINCRAYLENSTYVKNYDFLAVYHLDRVEFIDFNNYTPPVRDKKSKIHRLKNYLKKIIFKIYRTKH